MGNFNAYMMLSLFAASFLFFALGTATRLSSWTGGHKRTHWWSLIFSGTGFICLSAAGLASSAFISGWTTPLLAVFMALFGGWQLVLGLKTRRAALSAGRKD